MNIQVVTADFSQPSHREAIVRLLASYAGEASSGAGTPLSQFARANLVDGLGSRPQSLVLLAEIDNQFVGLAVAFEGYSTFAARPLLNLHDLVVDPEWQGRGIGSRLLEALDAEARRRACCVITLEVNGPNRGAQRLYRRHGFEGGDSISPPEAMMFWKKQLD